MNVNNSNLSTFLKGLEAGLDLGNSAHAKPSSNETASTSKGPAWGANVESSSPASGVSWGPKEETRGQPNAASNANTASGNADNESQSNLVDQLMAMIRRLMEGMSGSSSSDGSQQASPQTGQRAAQTPAQDIQGPSNQQSPYTASPSQLSNSVGSQENSNFGTGSHGGANTVPDRIASPEAATQMIQDVKSAGGGTLRIQMTHDQINDPAQMAKLKALVDEGDKQGVKVQFTLRDNDNGGGGNVLSGDKLKQASDDIKNVVSSLGNHPSFTLDTFNEGGKSATQGWADMQSTLIKSARDAGYKGDIVVEDSNWGGGLTAGGESGLVKYADQLKAANGDNNPGLIGSIHEYANGDDASSRLTGEIKALQGAGFKPQIGEVGNANWTGGSNFEERDGANKAVKDNMTALKDAGADVLPWMDQFQEGKISHNVGFSKTDQFS